MIDTRAVAHGEVIALRPAPVPAAWLALAWLLAALFGLPSMAILFAPRRWDGLSLAAMATGFGIAGFAVVAARQAQRSRRPQQVLLATDRIVADAGAVPWAVIRSVEAVAPASPSVANGGPPTLGLRIAAARAAHEWRVDLLLEDGRRVLVGQGLDAPAAAQLRDRINAAMVARQSG